MLFVLGLLWSVVLEALGLKDRINVFGQSYTRWMAIDPHTLLFTRLPALLAGDAMTIDTQVAKRVTNQVLWMAGPGVVIQAFMVAGFSMVYHGPRGHRGLVEGAGRLAGLHGADPGGEPA